LSTPRLGISLSSVVLLGFALTFGGSNCGGDSPAGGGKGGGGQAGSMATGGRGASNRVMAPVNRATPASAW